MGGPDPRLSPAGVRDLRHRLGLTQAAFAERLGVSAQAVSFWERGTRTPTGLYAAALRRLAAEAGGTAGADEPDGEGIAVPE